MDIETQGRIMAEVKGLIEQANGVQLDNLERMINGRREEIEAQVLSYLPDEVVEMLICVDDGTRDSHLRDARNMIQEKTGLAPSDIAAVLRERVREGRREQVLKLRTKALAPEHKQLVRAGEKIQAIKALRNDTGITLMQAKRIIEEFLKEEHGIVSPH